MKSKIFFIIIASSIFLSAYKIISTNNSSANVEQQQGLYLFMFSKPTSEYEYLGSVKKSIAWTGQPTEMLNSMIKKIKRDFPLADGVIFTSADMDKADAIKFKEK